MRREVLCPEVCHPDHMMGRRAVGAASEGEPEKVAKVTQSWASDTEGERALARPSHTSIRSDPTRGGDKHVRRGEYRHRQKKNAGYNDGSTSSSRPDTRYSHGVRRVVVVLKYRL